MTAPVPDRVNIVTNPRAVQSGSNCYTSGRWGTGGAGTNVWVVDPPPGNVPPGTNILTAYRKQWTTAPSNISNSGFRILEWNEPDVSFAVTPGKTVVLSAYVRTNAASSKGIVPKIEFKTTAQNGTVVNVASGATTQINSATWPNWTRVSVSGVVPATATAAALYVEVVPGASVWAVGNALDVTGVMLETAPALGSYVDGSIVGTGGYLYVWDGAAHSSTSRARAPQVNPDGTIRATCELWIGGTRYADGQPAESPTAPVALSGLSVRWGRDTSVDQPGPSTCSFAVLDPPSGAAYDAGKLVLGATVRVYADVSAARVIVFDGRITDLDVEWDDDGGGARVKVTAVDALGDLANRYVGAEPWPAEALWQRAYRIVTAVGLDPSKFLYDPIPSPPALLTVSRMDVDRQSSAALLGEVAITGGMILWTQCTEAAGPQLRYEDPNARTSMSRFVKDAGTGLWAPSKTGDAGNALDACSLLRDPVHWLRDATDLFTRVTVRWADQSTSPGVTERSVMLVDAAAETTYGARGVSVGTLRTSATDANTLAQQTLAQHAPSDSYRADGLTWDLDDSIGTDSTQVALAARLLDSAARPGAALRLTSLPEWTPTAADVGCYLEGGAYRFLDGRWVLALNTLSPSGTGHSMTFAETPSAVRYADIHPAVRFIDMIGVSA